MKELIARFGSSVNYFVAGLLAFGVSQGWWTEDQAYAYGGAIAMATSGGVAAAKYSEAKK